MTKLSRLAPVMFLAAQIYTSAVEAPNRSLRQYYETLSDSGKSAFPDLSYRSEVTLSNGKKVAFYLVTGDIFQFVGESTRTAVWPVDAMLVSTNVELDFEAGNPAIQRRLRNELPKDIVATIIRTFNQNHSLNTYDQSLAISTRTGFSPATFAFIATDRRSGGTYDDSKWQTEQLDQANIARRIRSALVNTRSRSPHTIVTPLVGASQVNLETGFLQSVTDRIELRERMQKSISGILKGFETYFTSGLGSSTTLDEVAIVVWPTDVKRVIPDSMLKDKSFLLKDTPGGYLSLQNGLLGAFKDALAELDRSLKTSR
jgi:hypothetical protein